jgi:hypothetical protein
MRSKRNIILVVVSDLCHDSDGVHISDPTLTVAAPCGATLHILYLGSNPDGEKSLWRHATHSLDLIRFRMDGDKSLWRDAAQLYTDLGSNPDSDGAPWLEGVDGGRQVDEQSVAHTQYFLLGVY